MKGRLSISLVLTSLIIVIGMSRTGAQQVSPSTVAEFKPGQVWTYKTAPGADDSRIVILRLEPASKKGRIIHIRIEKLPLPNCGGFHLTTAIEHVAISERALRQSTVRLQTDRIELPESYFVAYHLWAKSRHKEVTDLPIVEIRVPPNSGGVMICNYRAGA